MATNEPAPDSVRKRIDEQRQRARRQKAEAISGWAQRKLATMDRTPVNAPAPAKPKKFKGGAKNKGKSKANIGVTLDQAEIDQAVTMEAQRHGEYRRVFHKTQEVVEGGKIVDKDVKVTRNMGATTVERWHRNRRLDDRQMAAIAIYERNYRLHLGMPQRVVANWSAVVVRMLTRSIENCNNARMDAKKLLLLFDQDINFRRGMGEWSVWQNVVLEDEPAGVAGSRLGFKSKQAEAAALVIVQSIANEIAALVIDQNPPDLDQLIVDIDAPRKPRKIA